MTSKQAQILEAALHLFAEQGVAQTPTSQIAKEAQTSEGLIFKHFGSKKGLIEAVLKDGQVRLSRLMDEIMEETVPRDLIFKTLDLPKTVLQQEPEFWRLQFSIKNQLKQLDLNVDTHSYLQPLIDATIAAFRELGYPKPELETQALLILIDGAGTLFHQGQDEAAFNLLAFLKEKYA